MSDDTHLDGSACAATLTLRILHPVEIVVALEALRDDFRDDIARIIGFPTGLELTELRDGVAGMAESLSPADTHEVARYLVSPLVPTLLAHIDDGDSPLTKDLETAVLSLLDEWPPTLVNLLLVLVLEAAGLHASGPTEGGEGPLRPGPSIQV